MDKKRDGTVWFVNHNARDDVFVLAYVSPFEPAARSSGEAGTVGTGGLTNENHHLPYVPYIYLHNAGADISFAFDTISSRQARESIQGFRRTTHFNHDLTKACRSCTSSFCRDLVEKLNAYCSEFRKENLIVYETRYTHVTI